ncbi:hypothetical protein MTO96_035544 [Rhipicephalus appendiculatus]
MKHLVSDFEEDFTVPASSETDDLNVTDEIKLDSATKEDQQHSTEAPSEVTASEEDGRLEIKDESKDETVSAPVPESTVEPPTVTDDLVSTEISAVTDPTWLMIHRRRMA